MAKLTFHQPDEEKMNAALKRYGHEPVGMILRLAWQEGLTRMEIHDLAWTDVDFSERLLRLPERQVPLEDDVAETLLRWKERCERFSPYVVVSDKFRKRMVEQSINVLARHALDAFGQTQVRLLDLRYDYIRRQLREHGLVYALRVSGLSYSTYRVGLPWLREIEGPEADPQEMPALDELRLWQLMQAERRTPAGIAMWLTDQAMLDITDITALTWDQVDFDHGLLHLPGRDIPMTTTLRMVLTDEKAQRGSEDDPHVILTPNSRKPMDISRLSTVVRAALIRGGLGELTISDLKRGSRRRSEREVLLEEVERRGSISRAEAAELLGVSLGMAYRRLLALAEEGKLLRINRRYYPAGQVVPPE